jgi:hypothetical protein
MSPEPMSLFPARDFTTCHIIQQPIHCCAINPPSPYRTYPMINQKRHWRLASYTPLFLTDFILLYKKYTEKFCICTYLIFKTTQPTLQIYRILLFLKFCYQFEHHNLLLLRKWIGLPLSELHVFLPPLPMPIMIFIISSPLKSIYKVVHKDDK